MAARAFHGWVLYDGACGFCQWWIPFWSGTLAKIGLDIAPLQTEWVRERLGLIDEAALIEDLRLLTTDGEQVLGADVYRYALRRIWWAYGFYLLSIAPLLRDVFDWTYRTFKANRYRIFKTCRMPPLE